MTAGTTAGPVPKGGNISDWFAKLTSAFSARWATAIRSRQDASRYLPQTIAHRGYKAAWPENSMAAFKGAVEVGAHAIETDLHLSRDGVVVLSHDPSLKRCYGVDKRISECNWDYLSSLQSVREPKQPLPRLSDLLEWLASPGREGIWLLLDIKIDDDAEKLVGALSDTLKKVPPTQNKPWDERVVLGCWNASYIQASRRLLPTYPVAHITWYLPYARHFLSIPNLGYNVFQRALVGCKGSRFLHDAQSEDRPVYAWTVNEERWMRWCIEQNNPAGSSGTSSPSETKPLLGENSPAGASTGVSAARGVRLIDGVITDDPKLFLEVCRRWEDERDGKVAPAKGPGLVQSIRTGLATFLQGLMFRVMSTGFFLHNRYITNRLDLLPADKTHPKNE
ncbi:unnamed protein product [Clonostachys solani]|uniref:GP-PDE domain-containing protein n=1 Tax=Clonostachys solani TaxID=160281 RepID=A0A9N9ZLZ3_9HYPO|nr:unnamed protein product [Clonostachys solani]